MKCCDERRRNKAMIVWPTTLMHYNLFVKHCTSYLNFKSYQGNSNMMVVSHNQTSTLKLTTWREVRHRGAHQSKYNKFNRFVRLLNIHVLALARSLQHIKLAITEKALHNGGKKLTYLHYKTTLLIHTMVRFSPSTHFGFQPHANNTNASKITS